jgi:thiol-disulfide isomerase/thioredoxin
MSKFMRLRSALLLGGLILALAAPLQAEVILQDFPAAQKAAAEAGKLVVIDFYADWCGPCKTFTALSHRDPALMAAIEGIVLVKVDAEKGDGVALSREHGIIGYPTFAVLNADGETLQRWYGWEGVEAWIASVSAAQTDPTTLAQKTARHADSPNVEDAKSLAQATASMGKAREAVGYHRELIQLDPEHGIAHAEAALQAVAGGLRGGQFDVADLDATASDFLALDGITDSQIVSVASVMDHYIDGDMRSKVIPYLQQALAVPSSGLESGELRALAKLKVSHALVVENDVEKALELRRALLPVGYMDDSAQLNAFAWWCFEHNVNLEEAEGMARHAVEIATDPGDKANILDTVAEICNLRGDCRDAVSLMERALELKPDSEYLKQQLQRFTTLLAEAG